MEFALRTPRDQFAIHNSCTYPGGIRPGPIYGETDDFSYNIVKNPVHVRDLNAPILHCLGIDHERLSVRHQGLDVRLTGVEPARVVADILA